MAEGKSEVKPLLDELKDIERKIERRERVDPNLNQNLTVLIRGLITGKRMIDWL